MRGWPGTLHGKWMQTMSKEFIDPELFCDPYFNINIQLYYTLVHLQTSFSNFRDSMSLCNAKRSLGDAKMLYKCATLIKRRRILQCWGAVHCKKYPAHVGDSVQLYIFKWAIADICNSTLLCIGRHVYLMLAILCFWNLIFFKNPFLMSSGSWKLRNGYVKNFVQVRPLLPSKN